MLKRAIVISLLFAGPAFAQTYDANGREKVNVETGAVTCSQATAANLKMDLSGTGANATAIKTDSSATTQPVSGTVTCNAGTGSLDVDVLTMPTTNVDTTSADQITPLGAAADGAAVSGNPLRIGGKDGSGNTQDIATDTSGELQVDVLTMPTTTVTATNLDVQIGGSDSLTIGTFPDNEPFNVAQMNGVTPLMGNGPSGTGAQRVTIANDSTGILAGVTTVTTVTNLTNLPNEGQQTAANSISVAPDTDNDAIGAQGSAPPGEYVAIGGVTSGATGGFLNGIPVCTEFFAVDIVTATTTLAITGVSGRHVYICSLNLVTAAANNVAIIAGTGATCGTSTAGLNGGTTGAEGWNFAANGGLSQGSGFGAIMSTLASGGATGDSVCIVTTAATQLSGTIGFAIY